MWGTSSEKKWQTGSNSNGGEQEVPMHNVQETEESSRGRDGAPTGTEGTSALPSTDAGPGNTADGTWGERDVGGHIDQRAAMEEYEEMRRELTKLSLSRSKSAAGRSESRASTLQRITSRGTTASRRRASFVGTGDAGNLDADGEAQIGHDGKEDFELGPFLKEGHFEKRNEGGESAKKIGVVFKDLTVKGTGSTATHVRTLPSAVLGTFGPDLWKLLTRFIPAVHLARRPPTRTLIHDFSGVVRDGEMMLVLGRPGAGCSTLLRVIANTRASYAEVTGEVQYGSIPAEEQRKHYRGEVSYNPEDDIHLPNLSVWQTLQFALLNKTRKHSKEDLPILVNALMKIFGISHTKDTRVGNAFVPGISGGERKRVSIAETLATKSTVISWDNSTRGLDASTALDFARSLRVMTDISNRTTLTTLYQTSQAIYDLMDKVLLIDSGRMVYQGPASEAKGYFEKLGYLCPDRQTTADFLTAVTDPLERQFRDGMEAQAPKGAEELERVFKNSPNYKAVLEDVKRYEDQLKRTENADAKEFVKSVQEDKSRTVSKRSPYTVSFFRQVLACTRREFWLIKGDPTTLYTKYFIIIANGLIVGSLFYGQGDSTSSIFSRGGTLFFSILFLGWLQLSELMKAVSGREVVARQREYAFYRPSAVNLARVITDFPMLLPQVAVFGIIMYFLSGLDANVSKFWIYFLFVYLTAIMATALYRMFAALAPTINDAVRFSGISLNILVIYTGYVITKPQLISQKIWFGWLYYVNPISYAFEAVISNEFTGREFECAPTQLVPQGPGVDPQYQGCAIAGSQLGRTSVSGATYLETQFNYTRSHLWRNLGVLIAFAVLYILVTMAASEIFSFVGGGGGALIFKKSKKTKTLSLRPTPADEEMAGDAGDSSASSEKIRSNDEYGRHNMQKISGSESVFTWTDIEYSVPTPAGPKKLLNHVNGYVKPGVLVALMGVSGAGKTTLLNSLSQRHRMGVVSGEMMVDGRPLGPEFQRGTGYCEQQDLHDTTATIREALEFSAVLRQERTVLKSEKLAYVETVLDLLELREIQDAVISSLGVEQRKRLTIGVELAAKPNLLLFLDEPTSGLDSQSAFNIVHFLRKLSDAGQAIICTIHQPSAVLIQQFDMILALNPGGNLFYFGDVGESGQTVLQYFKDRGIDCPPNKNPAEFMLELAAKGATRKDGRKINWDEEWRDSEENKKVLQEIDHLKSERKKVNQPDPITLHEFASPAWLQTTELTKRMFTQYWRDPAYLYGKLFTAVIVGIFNGFTFWKLGNSIQDMQNRMFTSFLIILIPPTVVNGVLPKFFSNLALWMARERPSKIYGWVAFCTANIVSEIPIAIFSGTIYWALWYWATGLPRDSSTSGYVYLMTVLFFLFQASWGQWICAFAPSFTVISNVLPFFFVVFSLFNGVIRSYAQLPVIWRYTVYYIVPSTYYIGGVLAATLNGTPIQCLDQEAAHFNPPPGQTCEQYAGAFANSSPGYLTNPSATSNCGYCSFSVGDDYLKTLNIKASDKWPDFGIFLAFCISNWALVYFFIWSVRVKGWSFGFGFVFGMLGKGVDAVKKGARSLFVKKQK